MPLNCPSVTHRRRVATLVAEAVPPGDVFTAVAGPYLLRPTARSTWIGRPRHTMRPLWAAAAETGWSLPIPASR
jgi:hypothetical protein